MYDCLEPKPGGKNNWTKPFLPCKVKFRCFKCNRLLFTGRIEAGVVQIKCGKCGEVITVGANNSTPPLH